MSKKQRPLPEHLDRPADKIKKPGGSSQMMAGLLEFYDHVLSKKGGYWSTCGDGQAYACMGIICGSNRKRWSQFQQHLILVFGKDNIPTEMQSASLANRACYVIGKATQQQIFQALTNAFWDDFRTDYNKRLNA